MQVSFQTLLEPLRGLQYSPLDVTANAWFDDFHVFTFGVKDLDLLLCNVIEFAFDNTASAVGQIELTEVGPPSVLCIIGCGQHSPGHMRLLCIRAPYLQELHVCVRMARESGVWPVPMLHRRSAVRPVCACWSAVTSAFSHVPHL